MIGFALVAMTLSEDGIFLRNQGDYRMGYVNELSCAGAAKCSWSGQFGAIRVDEQTPRATSPLYVDGGYVACAPASGSSAGCVTTETQYFEGSKVFNDVSSFVDTSYTLIPSLGTKVSVVSSTGVAVNGPIVPETSGTGVRLLGRRSPGDMAANVQVESQHWRDGGVLFQVNTPHPCNASTLSVTPDGIYFGGTSNADCTGTGNDDTGALVEASGQSGHTALMASSKYYLTLKGSLGDNCDAVLADGGRPGADGGTWVRTLSDGGTCFEYGGNHGDVTIRSSAPRYGGLLFEVKNPLTGGSTDRVFQLGPYGGISNHSGLTRAQFQQCPGVVIITSLGQYQYGAQGGELMYAADTEHWYVCKSTGWKKLKDEDDP